MSQQTGPQRLSTSYPTRNEYGQPTESSNPSSQPTATMPLLNSSAQQPFPASSGRGFELPPLPRSMTVTGGSFPSMNPARSNTGSSIVHIKRQDDDQDDYSRRRKVPQADNAAFQAPALPPVSLTDSRKVHLSLPPMSPSPQAIMQADRPQQRPFLTPRSPLERAASYSHSHLQRTNSLSQHQAQPISPRTRTYTPGSGSQGDSPMPSAPSGAWQTTSSVPQASHYALSHPKRHSPNTGSNLFGHPTVLPSGSASPSNSYSSYSQADQTSPHSQYRPTAGPSSRGRFSGSTEPSNKTAGSISATSSHDQASESDRTMSIPVTTSGGQNTYQMMTLETTSGTVQVPVDVQAASRLADEKRRRNAGASARFRERRKKKEVEASATIRKLEHRVKDAMEDADFYRRERDYFVGILLHSAGGDAHFPRPESPRIRRPTPSAMEAARNDYRSQDPDSQEYDSEDSNVRQRTESYPPSQGRSNLLQTTREPSAYPPPPVAFVHPSQPMAQQVSQPPNSSTYAQHTARSSGPPLPPPPGPALPPINTLPPPSIMQASPTTGPLNPYASQPYEMHPPPSLQGLPRHHR